MQKSSNYVRILNFRARVDSARPPLKSKKPALSEVEGVGQPQQSWFKRRTEHMRVIQSAASERAVLGSFPAIIS